jgi:hypothetical protein
MTTRKASLGVFDEIRGYWRGQGPLWKLYWIYGVLVSTLGGSILTTAVQQRLLPTPLLLVLLAAGLAYTCFILISIWRSAFNIESAPFGIDSQTWGWLARVLTFGWALNAVGASLMLVQYALNY